MAKEFAKGFYNSKRWQQCRDSYIAKRKSIDGGLCETCRERLGYIVHHRIELTPENINDPDIALSHGNFKYDCHICHNKENKNQDECSSLTAYEFDENGEICPLPPEKNLKK